MIFGCYYLYSKSYPGNRIYLLSSGLRRSPHRPARLPEKREILSCNVTCAEFRAKSEKYLI
jgi:hypothetical protein